MKCFLYIVLVLLIYSCSNDSSVKQNEKPLVKDSLVVVSDTFNIPDLMHKPSLQSDIPLDTIDIPQSKKHTGINIVIPKLSPKNFPEAYKWIKALVENTNEDFYETISDEKAVYDTSLQIYRGWGMWIEPKSLYISKNVLSFAIETGQGYTGMPSGFEFKTINFDIEKRKEIQFGDFFKFETTSDSAFWAKIIGTRMHGKPITNMREFLEFRGSINFAFDNNNVYFFFDKYDIFGWGIVGVKRKYINHMIKERYR